MILLEGPDGSGKSLLGDRLGRVLLAKLIHQGGPPQNYRDLIARLQTQLDNFGSILDRSPIISERVYGPILRGGMLASEVVLDQWTDRFIEAGWILIYCRPPDQILLDYAESRLAKIAREKSYKSEEHVRGVRDNMPKIISAYDETIELVRKKGMMVLTYVRS
jgi:hypothetical protein